MRVVQGLSRRFWIFHMKREDFNIAAELHARLLLDLANGEAVAAVAASNALVDYLEASRTRKQRLEMTSLSFCALNRRLLS